MASHPIDEKAVFNTARRITSPDARAEYLQQVCGADAEALKRVVDLLRVHEQEHSFLESPAVVVESTPTIEQALERPGTPIGPYKLLQQIGEGGFGVVYMAEQLEPVRRKVALKIIKPGMDTRQVIARFEAERQALSLMDHPNIAKVLDAGTTESGRPYFVMELVKGQPITQYCDEKHLTPRQRLELLLPVCHAIQHAHQKGIIHRDIKPTNILVAEYDEKPVPKVIDFGVAKAIGSALTEKTMFTGFGQIVGTLEFMSPEQAKVNELDIDTRSDIYSLGVLMYELLTGSTPFDPRRLRSAAFDEMLRIIREEEPPKPSTRLSESKESLPSISAQRHTEPATLTKLVRGELDWIVMKALEKDRSRRYETANGLAMDVQHYLNDEPVQACPPSAAYRLRKFARRNKGALATAGLVLFFVVLLGGIVGWGMRDRAAREQEIAQEEARKLAATEQGIRQALDRAATSRAELHALLKKPGGVQQLLNQPARWELFIKTAQGDLAQARQLARNAAGGLAAEWDQVMNRFEQQLASDRADYDLALRLERISLDRATTVEGRYGHHKAVAEYPEAFGGFAVLDDDAAAAADRIASSPIRERLVAALDEWAMLAFILADEGLAEKLLAVARQAAPDPAWGDRLRQVKVWRDQEALSKLVAQAPSGGLSPQSLYLVGILLKRDKSPLAESWLRQAQAEHPADFWLNFQLAVTIHKTNPLEAAGYYRVAIAVRPTSSAVFRNLGLALYHQNKLNEAVAAFRQAVELDPKDAKTHYDLGVGLYHQKNLNEAVAAYRKAIELDPKDAKAHYNLGVTLKAQNKLDEAIAASRKAIEIDPKHASAHYNLGWQLQAQGKVDEAIAYYRKAIELEPKHALAHHILGWALANHSDPKLRDPNRAVELGKEAVEIDPQSGLAWQYLGWIQYRAGNWKASIAALEKSCDLEKGGDAGQWIVLSLAHGKLANEKDLAEDERTRHRAEASRLYDQAAKQIAVVGPGDSTTEAIRAFRVEAAELLGIKEKPK